MSPNIQPKARLSVSGSKRLFQSPNDPRKEAAVMMKNLPKIPRSEYRTRWERVQEVLRSEGLDMLLVYADDRFTYGTAYARYYGDLPVAFEPVLIMFVPGRDPALLVGPETDGYAREVSAFNDICILREFAAENEDYPFSKMVSLREAADARTSGVIHRIGIGGRSLIGADILDTVRAVFPGAEIIGADAVLEPLRGIKSRAEIEVIRYAYHLVNLGMAAAVDAIKPGVSEREVAAEAEYVMRKNGADGTGIDTMVVSGPNTRHIIGRTTDRVIQENDMVVVTLAPRYEGYHAACGRVVFLGQQDPRQLASVLAQVDAQNTCGANLIPGRLGRDVEAMGRMIMTDAGYGENFLYSGLHSVGVIEFEPPILGPSSETVIAENMVISVDIPLYEADVNGSRIEDGYLITKDGPVRLTTVPHWITK